jgi:hypothetical protein
MSQRADFTWPQGQDLTLQFNYKEGNKLLNLSSGYELRMDIVHPTTRAVVITVPTVGQSTVNLSGSAPNITVTLPRALTLTGGAVYAVLGSTKTFDYDIFLRNTNTDQQVKILRGQIRIEGSATQWQ